MVSIGNTAYCPAIVTDAELFSQEMCVIVHIHLNSIIRWPVVVNILKTQTLGKFLVVYLPELFGTLSSKQIPLTNRFATD